MNSILVNGTEITPDQIYSEMQFFPSTTVDDAQQAATRSLVIKELLCQRADSLGLKADNTDDLLEMLIEKEVEIPHPTEEECVRFYDSHPVEFSSSPLVEARHILLGAAPDDAKKRSDSVAQAEALIKRLEESPDEFAKLAEKFSECPSKATGGSLGQVSQGQTVAEFEKVLFRAETGLMRHPVESRYGVHVVYIDRSIPGQQLPYEMVVETIRHYLEERAERQAVADYLRRLADSAEIEGYEIAESPLIQ
ncbi:parvulin peptidyl-prolyl isomerase [Hahella sp. CCB-MM4]|uniref:peptidylprolyl isomerase n=1 Tax=Hahella sp. (strain CCB-MM4) TaxID=1926491 RepID=UPI000B9B4165|nr:peptidylprolyl isomerase [Hahella sp. CCB-MM4]OZG72334.1 parvulin peptidyl-prolyl isomerase [Hahella sp. CCB-MM4]